LNADDTDELIMKMKMTCNMWWQADKSNWNKTQLWQRPAICIKKK